MNAASLDSRAVFRGASFPYWHETILAALLAALFAAAGALEPRFVEPAVQVSLLGETWALAFVALPVALIIITGGIDLSVGSIAGLCAVAFGLIVEAGGPVWLAALAAVALGACGGLVNALLVAGVGIHPLIVTLATMAGFRGIALAATRGRTIQGFPDDSAALVETLWMGLPAPMWGFIVAAAATALFLSRSATGRYLYAIGHNETASRYSGVPVRKIKFALYTLSGAAAGLAAVLMALRYEQAKADFAMGLELEVITAVVLGGISIFGGSGNIVGLLLGVMLLHELTKFVPWHWHVSELNSLVTGGLLIGSVLLNSLIVKKRT